MWEAVIILSRADQLNCRYLEAEAAVLEWLDARTIAVRETASPRDVLIYAVAVAEKHGIGKRALSNSTASIMPTRLPARTIFERRAEVEHAETVSGNALTRIAETGWVLPKLRGSG